jgi:hypothetical protein
MSYPTRLAVTAIFWGDLGLGIAMDLCPAGLER